MDSTAKKTEEGVTKDDRQVEGVIFVPFTTGSKLRSCLQNEDDKLIRTMRMPRLMYMERPRRTVADFLVEKDPWYCLQGVGNRETCPVCYWQKGKGISCTRENINYKLQYVQCEKEKEEEEKVDNTSNTNNKAKPKEARTG